MKKLVGILILIPIAAILFASGSASANWSVGSKGPNGTKPSLTIYKKTVGHLVSSNNEFINVCTATLVTPAPIRNEPAFPIIATAAHCVYDAEKDPGSFSPWDNQDIVYANGVRGNQKIIFYPYRSNVGYPVQSAVIPRFYPYEDYGNNNFDVAFLNLNVFAAIQLQKRVGSSAIAFGQNWRERYSVYGFPLDLKANPRFNGRNFISCFHKPVALDKTTGYLWPGPAPIRSACKSAGGGSGGPWFVNKRKDNYVQAISSFARGNRDNVYGARLGAVAREAWLLASNWNKTTNLANDNNGRHWPKNLNLLDTAYLWDISKTRRKDVQATAFEYCRAYRFLPCRVSQL
jgi:hypothetical protein